MQLTAKNYHSPENTALSVSKVKTFLISKEIFYKRYITHELPHEDTPSMQLGRIVDKAITQRTMHFFDRTYTKAVLKRDDAELYAKQKAMDPDRVLTPTMYDQAKAICERVLRAPFLQFYYRKGIKTTKQAVLTTEHQGVAICGMLDTLAIDGATAYIDDFKSSASAKMKSPMTWAWYSQDMGYLMQAAAYTFLVMRNYPDVSRIVFRHIVLSTSKAENYPIKLYLIPESLYLPELQRFLDACLEIQQTTDWSDTLPDWSTAETLPTQFTVNASDETEED